MVKRKANALWYYALGSVIAFGARSLKARQVVEVDLPMQLDGSGAVMF